MSIDVDDVGALCVAHALADLGEARILAVVHNTASVEGVGAISVINHYYGRDDIRLGAYHGKVGEPKGDAQSPWGFTRYPPQSPWQVGPYVPALVRKFSSPVKNNSQVPEAVAVLRKTLEEAPDGSVTVVSVGYATNLHNLLRSPPDTTSSRSGQDVRPRRSTPLRARCLRTRALSCVPPHRSR